MMKKIIFCLQTMVRGGVEKELITILKKMDPLEYEVTVLLLYIQDESIVEEIPQWVKIINMDINQQYFCGSTMGMTQARLKAGNVLEAILLPLKRVLKIGTTHSNQSIKSIPELTEKYDVAVCYHIHSPITLKYVAEKISATKKIGWIHNDFLTSGYPIQRLIPILSKYGKFVAVSQSVMDEFIQLCPSLSNIVFVVHNVLDENEIHKLAQSGELEAEYAIDPRVKILTVGRFTNQKGFDLAIEAGRRLRNFGYSFCWYFIGWGPDEEMLRSMIDQYALNNCFVILGMRLNPYPYIANSDIYVQPSRHEALCLTVQEALILKKPIICTHFAGSDEQITNGRTGYIVPVGDIDALVERIAYLINHKKERERLSENLNNQTQNDSGFKAILRVFEV